MAELVSSDLPGGYTGTITADQFNRLRDDLMKHHDHATDRGGPVGHDDLTDEPIDDTYLTHADLNTHVQGSGTSAAPDSPGGSQGVHGISSSEYLAGITKRQLVCQIGTGTTDRYNADDDEQRGRGTFGTPFTEPPDTVLCINTIGESSTVTVYQRLTTSFAVKFRFRDESGYAGGQQATPFVYMAWGWIEA